MQERMKELIAIINKASDAYYNEDIEIMSNFEYDALYDELVSLEAQTGIILPNSPTQSAGYDAVSKLQKVTHKHPALSLDKTKDRESLVGWLNGKEGLLSWKMDGLTIVAEYKNGKMVQAVTRGNGYVGEDITHNAKHFYGLPQTIPHKGSLTVRGEAVMTTKEFERINAELPATAAKYKNPRNLASATVRMLDANESSNRLIMFYAFDLVETDFVTTEKDMNQKSNQFSWLYHQGFEVVEHKIVSGETVVEAIEGFEKKVKTNEFPSDGLVLLLNEEKYGKSLGSTGKFPRNAIAFKWKDETVKSTIIDIQWSASRTGLLNPVAVFKPVEIEGTTVERASIHNVSIARELKLGIGSTVEVFKANLIIPQIAKTIESTGATFIPDRCPVCGGNTEVVNNLGIETLYCTNRDCAAKNIGKFSHFVSRDCMNIVGLSDATIEKFLASGFIKNLSDIYHITDFEKEITNMDGFGEKSFKKLRDAIEESRVRTFAQVLNAVGIAGIGKDMAKQISQHLGENAQETFVQCLESGYNFAQIDGIGLIINDNIYDWYNNASKRNEYFDLIKELTINDDVKSVKESRITGKTFVVTGSVEKFANRDELKKFIEEMGGKVSGSVSSKTDYLINNDISSNSGKNKKAKELGIQIINETDFLSLVE